MARLQQGSVPSRSDHASQDRASFFSPQNDLQPHHSEDHHPIQPGSEFRHMGVTINTQVTTPGKKLPPFQQDPDDFQRSPDGGVFLHPRTPVRVTSQSPAMSPSTTRIANIGVRRSQNGSMLLQSPARPGHASRMRQIFEEASLDNSFVQHEGVVLYPQLPNISRAAASPATRVQPSQQNNYRPGSFFPSSVPDSAAPDIEPPQRTPTPSSKQCSGSWSDDSGYLIEEPHIRTSTSNPSPKRRIYDWLSSLCEDEDARATSSPCKVESRNHDSSPDDRGSSLASYRTSHIQEGFLSTHRDPSIHNRSTTKLSTNEPSQKPGSVSGSLVVMPSHRHITDVCKRLDFDQPPLNAVQLAKSESPTAKQFTPLEDYQQNDDGPSSLQDRRILNDGGIELSPLSPNVCIERGPSRYHSANRVNNHTPQRVRHGSPPVFCIAGHLHENTSIGYGNPQPRGNPRTVRNMRKVTRFSRPLGHLAEGSRDKS